jgi:hypothetical protein
VRFHDRLLAIGTVGSCCDGPHLDVDHGVLWTSVDGHAWIAHDPIAAFDHALLDGIRTDGVRVVVTGRAAAPGTADGRLAGAAWASVDGETWTRSADPAPTDVVVGASGLIGAIRGEAIGAASGVRFFSSPDGLRWVGTGTYPAEMRAFAAAQDGSVMALGDLPGLARPDGTATTDVVAWRSADGSSWAGPQTIGRDAHPIVLVAHAEAFVAIVRAPYLLPDGSSEDDWQVWRLTADGSHTEARIPIGVGESLGSLFSIGDALVATGYTIADGASRLTVWVSTDGGLTWGRVPVQVAFADVEEEITGLLDTPGGLLAVGSRFDRVSGHPVPVAWVSER